MPESVEHHSIQVGSVQVTFALKRRPRRTLRIAVSPDRQVVVEAPEERSVGEILEHVRKRGAWIVRQLEHVRRYEPLPTPRRYVSGETHRYLGRQYRLKVIPAEREGVKLIRGYFQAFVKDAADAERVAQLLERWFTMHARVLLAQVPQFGARK